METLPINQQITDLKARAAQINAQLTDPGLKPQEKKELKRQFMLVSSEIATAKQAKTRQLAERGPVDKRIKPALRVANLLHAKTGRVQYFATEETAAGLLLLLEEVFAEDEKPVLISFFMVEPTSVDKIPPQWYELVSDEDEAKQE